jgi:hypothetical protein
MSSSGAIGGDASIGQELPPYRAILVVDAEGYGRLPSARQSRVSEQIGQLLEAAFEYAGMAAAWDDRRFAAHFQGTFVLGLDPRWLPRLVHPLLQVLQDVLREPRPVRDQPPRLRASIHVGPLQDRGEPSDGVGQPMTDTHRLVDSEAVRRALRETHEDVTFLVAILSSRVFEDVVLSGYGNLHPSQCTKVVATANGRSQEAYLYVPVPSRAREDSADSDQKAAPPDPAPPRVVFDQRHQRVNRQVNRG